MHRLCAAKPAASPAAAPPSKDTKPRGRAAPPPDLDALDVGEGDEVFIPGRTQIHTGPFAGIDKRLIYLGAAAIALVFLFGLYVALRPAAKEDVAEAPPPPLIPLTTPPPVAVDPQPVVPPAPIVQVIQNPATTNASQPATRPAWMSLIPIAPKAEPPRISDRLVESTIKKAVAFLKPLMSEGASAMPTGDDMYEGRYALCVYALLQAGLAIDDPELGTSSPFMQGLLDHMKRFPMTNRFATYDRSLRASALAVYGRESDQELLEKDKQWLLASEVGGAYDYTMPPKGTTVDKMAWDNSNCQYGVLGVWAAVQAGLFVPDKYWTDVEQHWLTSRDPDGGWQYRTQAASNLTMTCAGITTLCVTAEQLELIASKGKKDAPSRDDDRYKRCPGLPRKRGQHRR